MTGETGSGVGVESSPESRLGAFSMCEDMEELEVMS